MAPSINTSVHASSIREPEWEDIRIRRKFKKRMETTPGCLEDLLKKETVLLGDYRQLSQKIVRKPKFKWKALEKSEMEATHSNKVFCADNNLMLAILDEDEIKFKTCYHMHIRGDHGECPNGSELHEDLATMLEALFRARRKSGRILNLRKIHGFI
jgi:hypothetical protein